jgi:hypothetical protein
MKYKLDAAKTKEADVQKGNVRISETGAYKGEFVQAKKCVAGSGTEGVEFTFQAEDGSTANWMRLYTVKADGTEVFGMGLIMAAMTCLKVREMEPETITVEEWDKSANAKLPVEIENYTALCHKPIGVLLQKELKDNDKFQMNIVGFFEAATDKTATEILEKKPATALVKKIAALHDRDSRSKDDGGFSAPAPVAPASTSVSGDPFEDDLDF